MPLDRRVRRSRRELQRALVELSVEKGYEAVTVDDLANRADIARRTFYAHYIDKDDLLRAVVADLLDDLVTSTDLLRSSDLRHPDGVIVRRMFAHAADNRDIYRMILAGAGNGLGLRMLSNTIAGHAATVFSAQCEKFGLTPRLPIDFLARAFVGQHLTLTRWWLDEPTGYSLTDMTVMRVELFIQGEASAFGFTPAEMTFDTAQLPT